MTAIKEYEKYLQRQHNLEGQAEYLKNIIDTNLKDLEDKNSRLKVLEDALSLAKNCSKKFVDQIRTLEVLVTKALQMVFENDIEFFFEHVTDKAGNLKGLKIQVKSPNGHIGDPVDSLGTSVCQIISTILQICVLSITNETKPVVIGDELFTGINIKLKQRLELFIETMLHDASVQLISVSHYGLQANTQYVVYMENGISHVELI